MSQTTDSLSSSELFEGLTDAALADIDGRLRAAGFRKGELIYSPFDRGDALYLIEAGRVRLYRSAHDGRQLTLTGFKDIEGPSPTLLWNETTTLYTQILSGHVAAGQGGTVVASGVLVIRPEDFFFKQLFSFRTKGPSIAARLDGMNRFGAMFFGKVWDVYGPQAGPV